MKFYKKKWFWLLAVVVLILVIIIYSQVKNSGKGQQYEFVNVLRGNLQQTVDVTGLVQSSDKLDLHFEISGTVDKVAVQEGQEVKVGDLLANLKLADLSASVSQAEANLNQKLAGSSQEDVRYYESAVAVAKADLEKTKVEKASAIFTAESAVETAKNNLKLAEGGEDSQIVSDVYQDAVALAYSSLTALDDGLTQSDNILGIDNSLANDEFEDYLSVLDTSVLSKANSNYFSAKLNKNAVKEKVLILTTLSSHEEIDNTLVELQNSLSTMSSLLSSVSAVLSATPPIGDLSQAELDAKKTIIEATRTAISTKFTSVINQIQSITTAKNSYMTYNIAYEKSLRDLDNTKLQSQSLVEIKEASYNQAQANLDKIKASPREVDLAYYRATLSQAQANLSKAIMRAPIDGMVTKINKKAGELAMSNEVMVEILSPHFEIEVDIPETDIVKLAIGNKVEITLDAFGEDEKFLGSVVQIDPASTEIQDVVYYKVKIALDDGKEKVLSGMTANVLVSTEEKNDILYLPFRSVLSRNGSGEKYVRVLENGELKEINVTIGLRGDNGLVEILSGVEEGQEVVLKVIE